MLFVSPKRIFDTSDENLRIYKEEEKVCGFLKYINFPGAILT